MDTPLALSYLLLLVGILAVVGYLVVREVLRNRQLEKVISELQPKLQKQKGSPEEHYELGSVYLKKKLYAAAIKELQQAIKKSPSPFPEALNALGYAYFCQEQYDLAIKNYKEAVEAKPDYPIAWNNLGHAYEKKKLIPQAIEAYKQTITIDPDNKTAQQRLESLQKRV
ncbi:MAG: tetratricopeptide repeat protein [Pseudanabaenaceae cyanobacterium]